MFNSKKLNAGWLLPAEAIRLKSSFKEEGKRRI